jgi:hypothetical protein
LRWNVARRAEIVVERVEAIVDERILLLLQDAGVTHDLLRALGDHADANSPHDRVECAQQDR